MFKFKMGLQVKDKATGFVGRITARTEVEGQPNIYRVDGVDRYGGPTELWVVEDRLELCYGE